MKEEDGTHACVIVVYLKITIFLQKKCYILTLLAKKYFDEIRKIAKEKFSINIGKTVIKP